MMQIPNLPNYMQVPQPNYNAVKIDVHNPMVNVPAQQAPAQAPNSQYATPTMPYYNYPQGQLYSYPQAQTQPYYMPPVINTPETQAPAPTLVPPTVQQPAAQEVPVQEPKAETVPAPVVTEEPKTEGKKEEQPVAETTAKEEAPKTEAKPVEVVPPTPVTPQIDLNAFISKLTNSDYDVQATAMEDIANLADKDPKQATELLDTKVVDALTNIVNADTSKLEGPSEAQVAARQKANNNEQMTDEEKKLATELSPKEAAERNKSFAMYAAATLQKLYGEEVQKLNNSTVPLTELPGAVTVVEQLKNNPNPTVRKSAIEALSYIQTPAYAKDLETIFSIAQKDQDENVQKAATEALDKLKQMPAADAKSEDVKEQPAADATKAVEIPINNADKKPEEVKQAA